jgi:hypothetical protein
MQVLNFDKSEYPKIDSLPHLRKKSTLDKMIDQLVLNPPEEKNINEEIKTTSKNNENSTKCLVCDNLTEVKNLISISSCSHTFCESCFEMHTNECLSDISMLGKIDKCMACNTEIPSDQLKSLIGLQRFKKFTYFKKNITLINCPKCYDELESDSKREVNCSRCNYVFCKLCKEPFHDLDDCQEIYLQRRIKEMEDMEGGVTQCPRCRFPYIKNSNYCEHVYCLQPGCGVDFCFKCGCLRSPTLNHGNHYHRKECCFYAPIDQKYIHLNKDLGKRDCIECQRLGYKHLGEQHCQPPKSLRVPRRVDPDEVE